MFISPFTFVGNSLKNTQKYISFRIFINICILTVRQVIVHALNVTSTLTRLSSAIHVTLSSLKSGVWLVVMTYYIRFLVSG